MKMIKPRGCGWPEVELGDICEFAYGKSLPAKKRSGNGFPVYGSNGQVGFHKDALTNGATIVIGRKGSFGEVHFSSAPCSPIDTTYYITTEQTNAFLPWLARRLRCLGLDTLNRAAAIPGLNRTDAYRQKLLLPPFVEQQRIAGILDAADALRGKRRAALTQLDSLLHATFLDMFGDPVLNPMGWEMTTLPEISTKFTDGPFGSNLKSSHYVENGVRVIRLQNIGVGEMLDEDLAFISHEHFATLPRNHCKPNDVIIGTLGEPNLRACIIPEYLENSLNKADCLLLRVNNRQAHSSYICWLLNCQATVTKALKLVRGQTRGRISLGRIKELKVPLPPLDLQRRFAAVVESVERQKARQRAHLAELDTLFAALQQRAFAGEL